MSSLSTRDLEMLKLGREFERQDIKTALEKSARDLLRTNPEYSLHVGFVLEFLKELKTVE
jgi:hypothetical protein